MNRGHQGSARTRAQKEHKERTKERNNITEINPEITDEIN